MGSILGNQFAGGRRLRPATHDYALSNFPRLIYRLRQGSLHILVNNILDGKRVCNIKNPSHPKSECWIILESDFLICKGIAEQVALSIFPSDTQEIVEARIKSLVSVAF
jgi:hypothetical protein